MSNNSNLSALAAVLDDGTSGQVLQSTGSGGVQFADSSGSGVTVHANQAAMLTDAASSDEGTLHYETDNNRLYVKQTSGFYLLASIANVAPTIDSFSENTGGAGANNLTADGTFTLTAGSNTVITINASDANLDTLTYSATVTSGTATNVISSPSFPVTNQSSNVFTLTPASATGGTVTIRFDVSDGTNVSNVSHSFSISFLSWANASQQAQLQASDAAATDYFGYSVSNSSDGNRIIVGAYLEDVGGSASGAAYIFTRSGTTWSQEQKIYATDRAGSDYFGWSVDISADGTYAIVGARLEDAGGTDAGAAYIFSRSGTTWTQEAKIIASNAGASDYFGYAVSIDSDGDTAIVGAPNEDTGGGDAGSAYIFTRSGTTWTQEAKIVASDDQASDYFGMDVSISNDGNTAVLGAPNEDTTASNAGSVYIFTRSGSTWSQEAKIQASDAQGSDFFGKYVRVSGDGDNIISGAYLEDEAADGAGAAYIFTRSGTTWSQEAKLTASDGAAFDYFGISVGISSDGDTAIVGAAYEDTVPNDSGAAYVFTRSGTTWTEQDQLLASNAGGNDKFGVAVAMSGDGSTAIVGANEEDTTASNAGSVYVFVEG
jgi:hypothetical protein